jgi:thiol:disulfide interchange protein
MATYAKGFKKQTGEQILLKTIVGIIVTVMAIVLAVFLYDVITNEPNYSDFTAITKYDQILTQKNASNTQLQDYLVYFYQDSCVACNDVKAEALQLARDIEKMGIKVFFVNTASITETTAGDRQAFINAIGESNLSTPMIVAVADGVFHQTYIGVGPVKSVLTAVKADTFAPFN